MVRQGFLNLTAAEQDKIIDAALDEFAVKDFEAASLNSIIAKAEISKGSMYHYFANKEDLYLHLISHIIKIKKEFLSQALAASEKPPAEMTFFENLECQMLASVDFAAQHYREHQLSIRLQTLAEGPLKDRLLDDLTGAFEDYVETMVDEAMKAGEIRAEFDKGFVMRILKYTLMHFVDIYPESKSLVVNDREALKGESRKLSSFLRKGLQNDNSREELK